MIAVSKLVPQKLAKTDLNESSLLLPSSLNARQLSWMLAKQTHLSFNNWNRDQLAWLFF